MSFSVLCLWRKERRELISALPALPLSYRCQGVAQGQQVPVELCLSLYRNFLKPSLFFSATAELGAESLLSKEERKEVDGLHGARLARVLKHGNTSLLDAGNLALSQLPQWEGARRRSRLFSGRRLVAFARRELGLCYLLTAHYGSICLPRPR